jgi:hypothetical protein
MRFGAGRLPVVFGILPNLLSSRRIFRHCQSKFYTACSRTRAGGSSTVFAHELPSRSAGFDAENRLYLFALTVPVEKKTPDAILAAFAAEVARNAADYSAQN